MQEKMTAEEVNILSSCKSKALKDFTIGAAVGSGLGWAGLSALVMTYSFVTLNFEGQAL